jgi:DNA-binding CsgD family transcriptional regulator
MLQAGRVLDAGVTLDRAFAADVPGAVVNVSDAAVMVALGRVAIHAGDGRGARRLAKLAQGVFAQGPPEMRRHAAWLLALNAMAAGDAAGARARLAELGEDGDTSTLPTVVVDTADYAQLVRIGRDAGDEALAHSAVAAAEELRRRNPSVRSIAGVAAHARGLVERDPLMLADAIELFAGGPRRLAHASALEDYGALVLREGNRAGAADALGRALLLYTNSGAAWDASRVRRRLRDLGIRRRIVKAVRHDTGWAGLTDAEVAVVRLVAEGLTNREVAEQLFVSPHTVSMHLRHVFTKLEISSRVELTRLAYQREEAA